MNDGCQSALTLYLLADRDLCLACFHGYRCVIRQPRRYVHRQQSTARYSAAGSSPCSSWHVNVTPSPDRLDAVKSPAGTSGSSAVRKRSCCNTRSAPQQATHRSTGFNKWESTDPTSSASLADDAASGLPTLQYLVEAHRSLRHHAWLQGVIFLTLSSNGCDWQMRRTCASIPMLSAIKQGQFCGLLTCRSTAPPRRWRGSELVPPRGWHTNTHVAMAAFQVE